MLKLLPAEHKPISARALAMLVVPAGLSAEYNAPHYIICALQLVHSMSNSAEQSGMLCVKGPWWGLKWAVRCLLQGREGCVHVHGMQSGTTVLSSMQICVHHTIRKRATAMLWHSVLICGSCISLFWNYIWTQCVDVSPTGAWRSQPEKETSETFLMQESSNQKTRTCHTGAARDFPTIQATTRLG